MRGFSCISSWPAAKFHFSCVSIITLSSGSEKKKKKRDRENENRIDIRTKRHPGRPREYEETRYGIKLSFLSVRIQFQVAFLRLMPRRRSGWRGKNFHSILLHRYSMPPVIVHVLEYISRNRELFDGCNPMIVQTGKPI